jgi:hypothetical protein
VSLTSSTILVALDYLLEKKKWACERSRDMEWQRSIFFFCKTLKRNYPGTRTFIKRRFIA